MLKGHPFLERKVNGLTGRCGIPAIIISLFILPFIMMNFGCGKNEAKGPEEKVMNVKVWAVEKKSLRSNVETIGTLKPYEEVIIGSEIDGIVKNLRVSEGSPVSKGMVLLEIRETEYRLEVKKAEAALRQTEASLANAKQEYERKAALYKEELVTKQQFDDISARLAGQAPSPDHVREVVIGDNVWIGHCCMIFPGVRIGDGSVVSAGSVVHSHVPPRAVVAGNPARVLFRLQPPTQ